MLTRREILKVVGEDFESFWRKHDINPWTEMAKEALLDTSFVYRFCKGKKGIREINLYRLKDAGVKIKLKKILEANHCNDLHQQGRNLIEFWGFIDDIEERFERWRVMLGYKIIY